MGAKCSGCGQEHTDWVTKEHHDRVLEQRKGANADLRATKQQLEQALQERDAANEKLGSVDALTGQLEDLRGQLEQERGAFQRERALYDAGITDPEGRELAEFYYQRLAEADRPEFATWAAGLRDDPSKAPRGLAAFLPSGDAAPPPNDTPPPLPRPADHSAPPKPGPPDASPVYSAETLRNMSDEQYIEHRAEIFRSLQSA